MPPWPSVFTGAVASRVLAEAGLLKEAAEKSNGPAIIYAQLGNFSLRWVGVGKLSGDIYFPLPADLTVMEENGEPKCYPYRPVPIERFASCQISYPKELRMVPVLRTPRDSKPASGYWMHLTALKNYLKGSEFPQKYLVKSGELWKVDFRLGIALDRVKRTVQTGRIYTSEAVAFAESTGFVVAFEHDKGNLPQTGLVCLGGDMRGAEIKTFHHELEALGSPERGWDRFRMVLATPCPSRGGWLPPYVVRQDNEFVLLVNDLKARLISAVVPRHEVVSGWDMAKQRPKPAVRMAPAGSVYWFETIEGDTAALDVIWQNGLLHSASTEDEQARHREGFGRVWFGKMS